MKTYILLIILFCLGFVKTYAQHTNNTITGRVKSEKTDEFLPDIVIRAVMNRVSVMTGKDGAFKMQLVKLPDTLTFSHLGYETKKILVSSRD